MPKERISFEELDRYISALGDAKDVEQIIEILQKQVKALGFEKMAYWLRWHKQETKEPIILSTYPEDFLKHYAANDFQSHDMVGRFSNEKNTPFKWSDIAKELPVTRMQKALFADSSSVGLKSGGSIPIHGPHNMKATLSVASDIPGKEFDELFNYSRHELHLLAAYAHEKIAAVGLDSAEKSANLSSRETEILTWASRGKTYWEISVILNIQEDTVKKHMQNIFMRLGASNSLHAASKGIVHGLILP